MNPSEFDKLYSKLTNPNMENVASLFDITSYNVKIFDLSNKDDVPEYESLMLRLIDDVKNGKCIIWSNDRSVLSKKDGTQTWFAHIEWSEYKKNNPEKAKNE